MTDGLASTPLRRAIEQVLCCPTCIGPLALDERASEITCMVCRRGYPVVDGIPVFLPDGSLYQEQERQFRDAYAARQIEANLDTVVSEVARHHCLPVMEALARDFRARFESKEWILDIGVGYGWHWADRSGVATVLGIDMSIGNLRLAKRLTDGGHQVVLICCDAASLPFRERIISGVWSVQTFQHFPRSALQAVLVELDRVLQAKFQIETHNLNPALFHRFLYRLFGKHFHRRGKAEHMDLNRFSAAEWMEVWSGFREGGAEITFGCSELFFHPDLRIRPRRYPVKLEQTLATWAPGLAALFARQVRMQIRPKRVSASA